MFKIVGYQHQDDLEGGSNGQYVTVYEHADFQGKSKQLPIGRYGVLPFKNDSISSIQVPQGLRVTLYEHGNFGGRPRTYSSSISNLGDFNDATSSIIVEPAKWYDKLRPDQRIDFEKYIPPEITQKIRSKVEDKMKEETPGIVRWTGIHKSEMAKDRARERIRDKLPSFLEDRGIEDYLVGRQPIGTGSIWNRHLPSMGSGHPDYYHLRQYRGSGAYPKCKAPRERIGAVLKDGKTKGCLIPCTELKYPKRSKRCYASNAKIREEWNKAIEKDIAPEELYKTWSALPRREWYDKDPDDVKDWNEHKRLLKQYRALMPSFKALSEKIKENHKSIRECKDYRSKRCRDLKIEKEQLQDEYRPLFREIDALTKEMEDNFLVLDF